MGEVFRMLCVLFYFGEGGGVDRGGVGGRRGVIYIICYFIFVIGIEIFKLGELRKEMVGGWFY